MGKRKNRNRMAGAPAVTTVSNRTAPTVAHAMTTMVEPVLPYNDTSGHSGTDTSEERARHRDASGKTLSSQNDTLKYLHDAGDTGLTVQELRDMTGWHHGIASSSLTNLHGVNKIARLADKRNRCHIYVHPDFVNGRVTEQKGRNKKTVAVCPHCGGTL